MPNARAKRRGGKALPRSQKVTPRPLERTVGRAGQRKKGGCMAFALCFLPFGAIHGVPLLRPTALRSHNLTLFVRPVFCLEMLGFVPHPNLRPNEAYRVVSLAKIFKSVHKFMLDYW